MLIISIHLNLTKQISFILHRSDITLTPHEHYMELRHVTQDSVSFTTANSHLKRFSYLECKAKLVVPVEATSVSAVRLICNLDTTKALLSGRLTPGEKLAGTHYNRHLRGPTAGLDVSEDTFTTTISISNYRFIVIPQCD